MNSHGSYEYWSTVIADVLATGRLTIPKINFGGSITPRPEESGLFKRSIGEPKGQIADWRANIPGSDRGVHAVEFPGHYSIHVDHFDPAKHPVMHILRDSPMTLVTVIAAGLGAFLLLGIFSRK